MNIIKCSNGHYFDHDKFVTCPHCGAAVLEQKEPVIPEPVKPVEEDYPQTEAYTFTELKQDTDTEILHGADVPTYNDYSTVQTPAVEAVEPVEEPEEEVPAVHVIKAEENKPEIQNDNTEMFAGWAVCTKGPAYGKDFKIYSGWNRIGRDPEMRIWIPEDPGLIEHTHAAIVYDKMNTKFFLVNQNCTRVLLNGKPCEVPEELVSDDVITLGDTEMVFIAFCTEKRKWNK